MDGAVERSANLSPDRDLQAGAGETAALSGNSNFESRPHLPADGYVYFISDGEAVKIGFSEKPLRRIKGLQSGHPKPLTLLGTIPASVMDEMALHKRFDHLRIQGEWFRATLELTIYATDLCANQKPPTDDGKAERAALRELAGRYKGKDAVTYRVKALLNQMNNSKREKDEAVAAAIRGAMVRTMAELRQVLQDGGEYVPENHYGL